MIDPQSIAPTALPSVLLTARKDLPTIPCIYFAIDSQENVQYIGRTTNLQQRWVGHHRTKQLEKMKGVRIAYLSIDDISLLPSIEQALIDWFKPPLNGASAGENRNPRIMVTLKPKTHEILSRWADHDGLRISTLATHILKLATDAEEAKGRFTTSGEDGSDDPKS